MLLVSTAAVIVTAAGPVHAQPQGVASVIIDLRSNTTLSAERAEVIDRPVLPGSVMKIAALAAALESGLITPRTSVLCTSHQIARRAIHPPHS